MSLNLDDTHHPLHRRWPALRQRLMVRPLLAGPTPVEPLEHQGSRLWVKHDNHTSSLYGGNKVRKLEYILGRAMQLDTQAVWTMGGLGSHHALATAIYAEQLGLDVHVLHFEQPWNDHVRDNLLAISGTQAHLHLLEHHRNTLPLAAAALHARLTARYGARLLPIVAGGSDPWGSLGFVNAGLELAQQVRSGQLPEPARIYVPVGSCGTFAGLWLGCRLAGLGSKVIGVQVSDTVVANVATAAVLIHRTSRLLTRLCPQIPTLTPRPWHLHIERGHFGPAYGAPTRAGAQASQTFEPMGVKLDPTYTAKTAACLLERLQNSPSNGPLLLWNTFSNADLTPWMSQGSVDRLPGAYHPYFKDQD